jgi:hypothetical protein
MLLIKNNLSKIIVVPSKIGGWGILEHPEFWGRFTTS